MSLAQLDHQRKSRKGSRKGPQSLCVPLRKASRSFALKKHPGYLES